MVKDIALVDNRKLLERIKRGHVQNIRFDDLVRLVEAYEFRLSRVRGSHHYFVHERLPEVLNLQPVNGQAKDYQVKQLLRLIEGD